MQTWSAFLILPVAACTLSGQLGNKSWSGAPASSGSPAPTQSAGSDASGSSSGGGSTSVVMPTITGLTVEQARSALAAAGVTPREFAANPNGACDVPADETTLRPGTLCIQYPVAGAQTFATVSVSYVVEADSYEAGGQGSGRWRRMPDLLGKQIDDATKLLAQGQLTLADHFDVEEVDSPDCAGGVVCETYPRPRMRKVLARRGRITIGRKQVSTPPSSPTTPSSTAPTTQPTQSESFF